MPSRPTRVIRSSELRAARGKQRASQRGELNDLRARLVKTETQAFRNLRGDAATLETLAGLEGALSALAGIEDTLSDLSAQNWSLADDEAVSLTMPSSAGHVAALVWGGGVATLTANPWGMWFVRGSASPNIYTVYGTGISGTNVTLTTGALSGTTGADGDFTISTADGNVLWLENRSGSARSGKAVFFGRVA